MKNECESDSTNYIIDIFVCVCRIRGRTPCDAHDALSSMRFLFTLALLEDHLECELTFVSEYEVARRVRQWQSRRRRLLCTRDPVPRSNSIIITFYFRRVRLTGDYSCESIASQIARMDRRESHGRASDGIVLCVRYTRLMGVRLVCALVHTARDSSTLTCVTKSTAK